MTDMEILHTKAPIRSTGCARFSLVNELSAHSQMTSEWNTPSTGEPADLKIEHSYSQLSWCDGVPVWSARFVIDSFQTYPLMCTISGACSSVVSACLTTLLQSRSELYPDHLSTILGSFSVISVRFLRQGGTGEQRCSLQMYAIRAPCAHQASAAKPSVLGERAFKSIDGTK
ncbi:hypothetical protein T265_11103 [Opisthorchis viverrini]|uniref:Uncharacterized protein n=1 Tax=Opisthorchis viverrini TaxID=6198 RepID=A0A074Z480_OPIVI|nr:hypothetical protein T265_11103 [Opisthorchis viverrini]KER20322.1 hypothetical protein T265_11103 [Opisthorchis viverrini]